MSPDQEIIGNQRNHNHVWDIKVETVIGPNLVGQLVKCQGEFRKCTIDYCLAEEFKRLD